MRHIKRRFAFVALIFFSIGYYTNNFFTENKTQTPTVKQTLLGKIKNKKSLDVVILNSPTVYYHGINEQQGFEYKLISEYAKDLNVTLKLHVVTTIEDALAKSKSADITVAGLSVTEDRKKLYKFGPQYYQVKELLVCNQSMYKKDTFPRDVEDILGLNIIVGKNTSYEKTLTSLSKEIDGIKFKVTSKYSTPELLEMVNKNKIDCTVSDSNIYKINQRYYPEIHSAFAISNYRGLAWIIKKGDNSVKEDLYKWLNRYVRKGKMDILKDRYFGYLRPFDYFDTKIFHKRIKQRLPKYEKYFKGASKKYDVPWLLLAAQSYQESHWNPRAKSPTGVRGMMMLTLTTAKQMGIKNRLHPLSSIYAGAKYMKQLEKRFPKEVKGQDRYIFALAAYNIGMGHIHDAQTLARKLNKNPYIWKDLKTVLPLLSKKKYYKTLKYKYARGEEPVRYVNAIKRYANILMQSHSATK